jgi:hypothetical protein
MRRSPGTDLRSPTTASRPPGDVGAPIRLPGPILPPSRSLAEAPRRQRETIGAIGPRQLVSPDAPVQLTLVAEVGELEHPSGFGKQQRVLFAQTVGYPS